MPSPKVSVIIPIYNCEKYLPETVSSVLDQDYPDIELILINDGSPGPVKEVVASLEKRYPNRIIFINKKNNEGIAPTSNKALKKVTSKYFSVLGGDDIYLQGRVRTLVNFFEKNQDLGLVWSDGYLLSGDIKTKKRLVGEVEKKKNEAKDLYKEMLLGNFLLAPSLMHRTDLVRKLGGFNENIPNMEDWDLGLRIAKNYRFGYIDKPLVYYRVHEGSISRKYDIWLDTVLKTIEERKNNDKYPDHYYSAALAKVYFNYGYVLAKQGLVKKSLTSYFRAIKSSPSDISLYFSFPELMKHYIGVDSEKRA